MDISIIIVNWNTCDLLHNCLESVFQQETKYLYEVIVIDNGSKDRSSEMISEAYPSVNLIQNQKNIGFGAANNIAIAHANGNYLFLLNPDTVLMENVIDNLIEFMDDHKEAGMAGAKLLNPDGSVQPSCQVFPTLSTTILNSSMLLRIVPRKEWISKFDLSYWSYNSIRQVDWVTGAAMVIRRDVIEQIGGFDQTFFMYSEEIDLAYRVRNEGWEIYFVPDAEVMHYGGASSDLVPGRMKSKWAESHVFFFRKHYGEFNARLARIFLSIGYFLRLMLWSLIYLFNSKRRVLAKKRIDQWRDGLKWCLVGR